MGIDPCAACEVNMLITRRGPGTVSPIKMHPLPKHYSDRRLIEDDGLQLPHVHLHEDGTTLGFVTAVEKDLINVLYCIYYIKG